MGIQLLKEKTIHGLKNQVFAEHAERYRVIADNFETSVERFGLPFDRAGADRLAGESEALAAELKATGQVCFLNDGKSIVFGKKSPACHACEKGIDTATFFISFKCPRNCWFCFNPNQEGYDYYRRHLNNWREELADLKSSGAPVKYIALTGGEPLLHKAMALSFFRQVQKDFPGVHTRLYTSGDLLDSNLLSQLRQAGLDEIRFSIKLYDPPETQRLIWDRIATAIDFIPSVLVEMPVIPGTLDKMKEILDRLDKLGVFGINLLEFCFPLHNSAEFAKRGLKIKYPPFPVLYNYWYAGGLPVSGSETDCLRLMKYAVARQMKMNVHYCSLANKFTGQIYRQNICRRPDDRTLLFSQRDYFFKTIKIFPPESEKALAILNKTDSGLYRMEDGILQIHPSLFNRLEGTVSEAGLSWLVYEGREDGPFIRELRIDLVVPGYFDPNDL